MTAVVLLHGWPVTDLHWRFLVPRLRDAGFDPVPVTLPGLGAGPDGATSFRKRDLAERLREHLAAQGLTRFAVIGHDWGGTVATFLAAAAPEAVGALVLEEEILPGIDVDIPEDGAAHYPDWHGPFNRAPGLAEAVIPGREDAYYGAFLRQSAGPTGLDPVVLRSYIDAYRSPGVLEAGLAHYRTRADDLADVAQLRAAPIGAPVLAIGGRYAMGAAVAEGLRPLAADVSGIVLDESGHYPAEQEPEPTARAIIDFLQGFH
ncbi:alpha/beta fold hydrolase [Tsukamurella pseudospumae]|uniref:Alpha/beta hydrolase n=1 Tax=Tsukamurella pseudospumae TaxID=239498 RepID=A0A138AVI4_9ACTN|nr:alpha/beta hydrolase [Tsukamurella pseudospumae]KXO91330.1 alpha/beta hydrolase [Tsukamurella pseudospumae]KXP14386.1 alpha/beta hydrolase [Tsukamurella pseudospumae]